MFKKFLPFWLFLALFKFGAGLHYTLMAPLGAEVFPIWLVGALISLAALIELCFDIPGGYLLDIFGFKRLLLVGTIIFIGASAVFLFGLSQWTFLLSLLLSAFGWLFFGPGSNAYIFAEAKDNKVGKYFSLKDIFTSIGIILAAGALIFVVRLKVPEIGFTLIAILLCALVAIILSPQESKRSEEKVIAEEGEVGRRKNLFKNVMSAVTRLRPASFLLLSLAFSAASFYGIIWFVVPLLIATSIHNGVLGVGLGVFDFAIVVMGFAFGKLVDAYDKKLLVLLGLLIFSVFGMLLGLNFGIIFLLIGFLATSGQELASLSLWAWLYGLDKEHTHYGFIAGIIGFCEDLGWVVGPLAAGLLYTFVGPTLAIAFGGLLVLLNVALFFFLAHHPFPQYVGPLPEKPHHQRHKS